MLSQCYISYKGRLGSLRPQTCAQDGRYRNGVKLKLLSISLSTMLRARPRVEFAIFEDEVGTHVVRPSILLANPPPVPYGAERLPERSPSSLAPLPSTQRGKSPLHRGRREGWRARITKRGRTGRMSTDGSSEWSLDRTARGFIRCRHRV